MYLQRSVRLPFGVETVDFRKTEKPPSGSVHWETAEGAEELELEEGGGGGAPASEEEEEEV